MYLKGLNKYKGQFCSPKQVKSSYEYGSGKSSIPCHSPMFLLTNIPSIAPPPSRQAVTDAGQRVSEGQRGVVPRPCSSATHFRIDSVWNCTSCDRDFLQRPNSASQSYRVSCLSLIVSNANVKMHDGTLV
jgi:hypothetical protein